ncbi:MAG: sigma-70 family RNA polymerase sigma factor [Caulobacter sp.]|nr:sigma-70 family RNA polymerase sigma factor [Caulobacter sp.]
MQDVEAELKTLMLLGLDGDSAAQERLLSRLAALLAPFFARRLARGDAEVEDLVQETLIALHTRRESFDRASRFTPWAYAIARYKLIDHYRRSRVRGWRPLEEAGALFAQDLTGDAMAARDLAVLLGQLPPKQRSAIEQTRINGLSTEEASRATGLSPSAVKVSVHRGLKALMTRVNAGGGHADG